MKKIEFKNKKVIYFVTLIGIVAIMGIAYYVFASMSKDNINNNVNVVPNNGDTTSDTEVVVNSNINNNEDENSKFVKDKKIGSYIWFSGNRWRILSKDNDMIALVSDVPIAILNFNLEKNNNYSLSYIRSWLNGKYYNTLNNKDLIKRDTYVWKKNDDGTVNSVNDYVGMLTKEDYLKNKNIFSTGKYFWTMSASLHSNAQVYYVTNVGDMDIGTVDSKYGVKPVIKLVNTISIKNGNGTKAIPYKLAEENIASSGEKLNTRHSGEYLLYSDMIWRVVEKNENGTTRLALNNVVWGEGFDSNNIPVYSPDDSKNIGYFLNNVFYNNLSNKEWIIPENWYLKDFGYTVPEEPKPTSPEYIKYIRYNERLKYEADPNTRNSFPPPTLEEIAYARSRIESVSAYIGMLKIGDLLTYDSFSADWWLITQPKDSVNKLYYIYTLTGIISKADAFTNFPARPVINLDPAVYITEGDGSLENPYKLAK